MNIRKWSAGAVMTVGLVLVPTAASAGPPTTPGQRDVQGCRENGQAVSNLAKAGRDFGQTAAANSPLAPINALFFGIYCGP